MEQEIVNGNFREDLFNRLSSFHIHLPQLWEWREKIRREKLLISEKYMVAIKRYPWKGNVRELKNTVKRCLVVTEGEILDYQSLPLQMLELSENTGNNIGLDLASVEKHHIQKVLQHTNGYKPEAARLLGIGLTTLYRKMETYGL